MFLSSTFALAGALALAPPSEPPPSEPPTPTVPAVEDEPAQAADEPAQVADEPAQVEDEPEASVEYVLHDPAPLGPSAKQAPPLVEFYAGAMIMMRPEFRRERSTEGESTPSTIVPTRLRAKFGAHAADFGIHAEFQEARNLGDPIGSPRTGFHQLYGEYDAELRHAHLLVRIGRQEYGLGTRHLFWIAPWGAKMRSWDAARVTLDTPRGGIEFFAGSLANPLLSSELRLTEHIADSQALTWVINGYVRASEALIIEAMVMGGHERDSSQQRNLVTSGVYLHGDLMPGLTYDVEGHVQAGEIAIGRAVQTHLAGSAFAQLNYLTPKPLDRAGRFRFGGGGIFDFLSGSQCDSADIEDPDLPCTAGRSADFYTPWMARHRWFGFADRFWGGNVIDGALRVEARTQATKDVTINLEITNHLFAFPEPGGMWRNTGGSLIGVDPNNLNPWAAHEADIEGRLSYGWIRFDVGWHVVTHLAGGRAISGVAQWQRVYFQVLLDF